jgi:hypothetical protein
MTTGQPTDRDGYTRALDAEPRLQPIVAMVDALCALAGPDTRICSACAWEHIVKPLCMPLIGWERGRHPAVIEPARRLLFALSR